MAAGLRKRGCRLLIVYALLLAISTLVRFARGPQPIDPSLEGGPVPVFEAGTPTGREQHLAWQEFRGSDGFPVLFLHGSPGNERDLRRVAEELVTERNLYLFDLPGFGGSRGDWPDLSIDAQARSIAAWMDANEVERAHLVGFSMGGGVAIRVAAIEPERVASLTLIASIGVQELELFGSYELNHAVHAGQLWLLRAARWLTPHFGALDRSLLGESYARQFHETDQRPLRDDLLAWNGPALVIHGTRDFLVPPEAAQEHLRLLPQAEAVWIDASHFLPFMQPGETALALEPFLDEVEAGTALSRDDADATRLASSLDPWNPETAPPFEGMRLALLLGLLALATLVSEDLTCIAAGLLVASGRIEFVPATAACFFGILIGDVLLYAAGRAFGRPALERAPLRWMVSKASVERGARWFEQRGVRVVFLSRFLPGLRLPTYVAAGLVRASFPRFLIAFAVACALWTPILVGLSAWMGGSLEGIADRLGGAAPYAFIALLLGIFAVERLLLPVFSHRGRRLFGARIRRWRTWEFWPRWVFYPPIVLHIARLMWRYRSVRLVSAVNPAMPAGGVLGERKSQILDGLGRADGFIARHRLLQAADSVTDRLDAARRFLADESIEYPLVIKPDVGERGTDVRVLRDEADLLRELESRDRDQILQEYVSGPEFGIFVLRKPGADRFRIVSITRKQMPVVVGDGARTLERLVLDDDRAVCLYDHYLASNTERWLEVPADGERVQIVDLGTHCRGSIFLDGNDLLTEALEARLDRISKGYAGFHYGRYDLRAASEEALRDGRDFKLLEVNGLTSEPAHVYDPRYSASDARRCFREFWTEAFAIAAANHAAGAPLVSWRQLRRLLQN